MNGCIIVPYRAHGTQSIRESHLRRFIKHYKDFGIPIYVIEQNPKEIDGKLQGFMRGRLFNVGFLERGQNYDYAVYHDVDMYCFKDEVPPRYKNRIHGVFNSRDMYGYPQQPAHLCTHASQFNFKLPYSTFAGGVVSFNTSDYKAIGGFSNKIAGYGNEDDDLWRQITRKGFKLERKDVWYECADHGRDIIPTLFREGRKIVEKGRDEDDKLETTQYSILDVKKFDSYEMITVDLDY